MKDSFAVEQTEVDHVEIIGNQPGRFHIKPDSNAFSFISLTM